MDRRIVDDTEGCRMCLVVDLPISLLNNSSEILVSIQFKSWSFCTTEGRSQGAENGEREGEEGSQGLDQVGRGRSEGLVEGMENTLPDALEGPQTPKGLDVLSCETESALATVGRDRCSNPHVHSAAPPTLMHVVQGCLASHFWRGEVNSRFSGSDSEYNATCYTVFSRLIARERERDSHQCYAPRLKDRL